jgi:uncharacterized membrane protein YphA (DoxX/SURF4 family)
MNYMLSSVGRILYGLTLAYFGFGHLGGAEGMKMMVPSFIPDAIQVPLIYVTGVGLLASAAAIIINKWTKWAGYFAILFLLFTALAIHMPGISNPDQMQSMMSMVSMVKDLAMAATAMMIAGNSK